MQEALDRRCDRANRDHAAAGRPRDDQSRRRGNGTGLGALARNALAQRARSRSARYDYIFIDCPPSLGLLTVNALTAADDCIIPVQAEYYALEGLSQLTQVIWRVRDALNPTLHVSGVLVTMYDGRTRLAMEVIAELERHFPEQMFKTQIPRNIRISEAPSYGKPVDSVRREEPRLASLYGGRARNARTDRRPRVSAAQTRSRARPRRAAGRHARARLGGPGPAARDSGRRDHAQPVPAAQDLRRSRPGRTQDLDRRVRRAGADHRPPAR